MDKFKLRPKNNKGKKINTNNQVTKPVMMY